MIITQKNIKRRNSLRFSYDVIDNINNVNEKYYYKWGNNDLVSVESTNETFDKITLNLRNGNKIIKDYMVQCFALNDDRKEIEEITKVLTIMLMLFSF